MTIKSEIKTEKIRSLGFWDISEGVTLRRLILWSFECICFLLKVQQMAIPSRRWPQNPSIHVVFGPLLLTQPTPCGHSHSHACHHENATIECVDFWETKVQPWS